MGKHKSYNPFKMWGSYAGAVLLYLNWQFDVFDPTGLLTVKDMALGGLSLGGAIVLGSSSAGEFIV